MKNLSFIFAFLFIGWSVSASVNSTSAIYSNYNDSFIFTEGGVEFAVYPNGEFDFYFNPDFRNGNSVHISSPNVNISYNAGYNYEPYIQYDDYGAVIQIENVPVYYDYYGRIIQAGDIFMRYNNFGRLANVGNLHVHYNNYHRITHYTGFINPYNRRYVYRPWHDYYRRPNVNVSIVFGRPYRAYYEPRRISYNNYVTVYNNYYINNKRKRNFYRPSQKVRSYNYGQRTKTRRNISYDQGRASTGLASTRQREVGKSYSEKRAATRSERTVTRENASNNRVFADRNERSTNSKGRSSHVENSRKNTPVSTRERSTRNAQQRTGLLTERRSSERISRPATNSRERSIQSGNNTSVRNSATATRNRTIEKNNRSTERKSVSQRPSAKRSSSTVRKTSSSANTRSQVIRSKNSSRSRSSARNVNN